jgi:tetratricopeptide (TPR) repeat protein
LQGWKIILGVAVLLAVVLIIVNVTKEGPAAPVEKQSQGSLPPDHPPIDQAMLGELQSLEQAARDNPGDAHSQLNLANRLMDMRMYPRAIDTYRKYLELNPSNPDARVDMAVCYFQLAGVDTSHAGALTRSALAEMTEALKINPKHQIAMLNLGIVNLQLGDVKTSQEWFRKCIDTDPKTESAQKAKQLLNQHTFNQ